MPVCDDAGMFRHIEEISTADDLATCGLDFEWTPRSVAFVASTPVFSSQPAAILVMYLHTAIVVPRSHLFILPDGKMLRADRVFPGLELKAAHGAPIEISGVHVGPYLGSYVRIAMELDRPILDLKNRLLNTNGIISADYSVQVFSTYPEFRQMFCLAHSNLPVVGSEAYIAEYGSKCLGPPLITFETSAFYAEK